MATGIEYVDETWNPVAGCSHVGPGCGNCYAEKAARRLVDFGGKAAEPYRDLVDMTTARWTGKVVAIPERLSQPLHWRKPRRVLVPSMGDLFHPDISDEYIAVVFGVMAACSQHAFMVLTKRPARALEWFGWAGAETGFGRWKKYAAIACDYATNIDLPIRWSPIAPADWLWPLPNVLVGVSVWNQPSSDEFIPLLLRIPARLRWISYEPALGLLDLDAAFSACDRNGEPSGPRVNPDGSSAISWVVSGPENGPGARPARGEWFSSIRDQCANAGVPLFEKDGVARYVNRPLVRQFLEV